MFVSTSFLPESPKWLISKARKQEAAEAIKFYHGDYVDSMILSWLTVLLFAPFRFLGTFAIDKFGRRPVVFIAAGIMFSKLIFMFTAQLLVFVGSATSVTLYMAVANEIMSELFSSTGVGAVGTLLIAELIPSTARVSIAQITLFLPMASILPMIILYPMINSIFGPAFYVPMIIVQPILVGYLYSTVMPLPEPQKSKQSQELTDVWADFKKQAKSVAPRGKRIIHETQAYQMYCDLPPDRKSLDSTVSDKLRTNTSQLSDTSHIATPLRIRNARNSDRLAFILARQNRYHQQEELLGGPHNVFRDKCPAFVVSTSETETEDEIENQTEISSEIVGSVSRLMAGSQGRVGHGCSTPLSKANFTLAPLRKLDVSAVIKFDPKGPKDVFVNFPVSLISEGRAVDDSGKAVINAHDPIDSGKVKEESTLTHEQSSKRDGTYVVSHDVHSGPVDSGIPNGTYTIEPAVVNSNKEVIPIIEKDSQPNVSKDSTEISGRKTTIEQREERVNLSRKKNTNSFLEDMNIDIASPGRALFNRRPAKKIRVLSKTPVRGKHERQNTVDDSMEVSIVMSEITPQASVNMGDESMVDPQSEPRRVTILQTPTRAPCTSRVIRRTPAVNKTTVEEMELKTPEAEKNMPLDFNPLLMSSETTVPILVTARSSERKSTLIKRSVDRLSRPRLHVDQRCRRNEDLELNKISPSRAHAQRLPTCIDTSTANQSKVIHNLLFIIFIIAVIVCCLGDDSFEEMEVTGAITPFQPIDPSRMVVPNPEKSGTVQRLQQTRLHKTSIAQKATLFMDDESSSCRREEMKFKRVMDRKYPNIRSDERAGSLAKINQSSVTTIIDEESVHSRHNIQEFQERVTTDREMSSIRSADKTRNVIIDYEQEDEELSTCTKHMSIDDASHTTPVAATVLSNYSKGNFSISDYNMVHQSNKLLSDSVCTTGTPNNSMKENRHIFITESDNDLQSISSKCYP
uniref:MFS domain-containing protein n=1 Tax=Heterorhabditis bacteriophora TaxID=37862 RepID=A0A1I7XJR3_HETBA